MKKNEKRQVLSAFSLVGTIGVSMAACVAVGLFLGRYVDGWLGTSPWATLGGIVLGMAAGFWSMFKRVSEIERDE